MCACSPVQFFMTLWTVACEPPLVHGILQAKILELPFPSPGDLPDPGIKPGYFQSPTLAGGIFTTIATWETTI